MTEPIGLENKLYFWDTKDGNSYFKILDMTDPNWPSVSDIQGSERMQHVSHVARYGNKLIYIGSPNSFESPQFVECYNTETGTWKPKPLGQLPEKRTGFALVVVKADIYILGGSSDVHNGSQPLKSCLRLNNRTSQWEPISDMLCNRTDHCAFVSESRIHVYGGRVNGTDELSQTMEVYDIKQNSWSRFHLTDLEDIDKDPSLNVSYAVRVSLNSVSNVLTRD
ncbi:influenza virus NS1A-binding protein-like [Paramacrobiotus metropolitanus]|uniref:influenza virus NS1A-binding protein-like n=1 Tax=Paramacrobiotus metropolitanus TaxID=2943436 RepID=UPI002445F1B5|nr:influenza virus NS1A-binding protein-like [Paramacrobiotus metropolitanus]